MGLKYTSLKKYYKPGEKYLFLGNGMNQLDNPISWDDLLREVCRRVKVNVERGTKPYQLFFEQISFDIDRSKLVEDNVKKLKQIMGAEALKLQPNPVLADVINTGHYAHYITTNYDYCIERSLMTFFDPQKGKHLKRPKYSLYRYNKVNDHKVWHIHGECDNGYKGKLTNFSEASILIGFEHYADYLEKIHNLLKDNSGTGLAELMDNAQENWVHLFFTRDIDILGFGLDFTETHLWFILNFRARLKRKGAGLLNTIRWIIPEFTMQSQQERIDILQALGVKILLVGAAKGNYKAFYENFRNTLA